MQLSPPAHTEFVICDCTIEEHFEGGKEMGLEDYEVRGFQGWYRHVTLVMIVAACLASICAQARLSSTEPTTDEGTPSPCPLLPLTLPEVRHLLAHLRLPTTSQSDTAALLVVVATLPPEPCQFLPYQTALCCGVRPVQSGHTGPASLAGSSFLRRCHCSHSAATCRWRI
jgi:hypothetical protein